MGRPLVLMLLLCFALAPVQAQSLWTDVGNTLNVACRVTGGGGGVALPGVGLLPVGAISNTDWVCTLRSLYTFVNNSILNGDWAGFSREVAGRWITDLGNYLARDLGLGNLNGWIAQADDAVKGTYRDFRLKLLRSMREALAQQQASPQPDNPGLPVTTAGGLADEMERRNPLVGAGKQAAALSRTVDRYEQLAQAYRAEKAERQSLEALEANAATTTAKAAQIVGNPTLGQAGQADAILNKATTAISTREVAQIQVEALTTLMKQLSVFDSALISQVAEVAKQQVLTNNQLAEVIGKTAQAQSGQVDALKAGLEAVAEENLGQAREAASYVRAASDGMGRLFDPAAPQTLDWELFNR